MNIIEEIKQTITMELRPNSKGLEYLEAVLNKKGIELLYPILTKHLGPAAKESGKEANLPARIREAVDTLGGLRNGQSFFYREEGKKMIYAALWPWASDSGKITLKCGALELF